jgi:hypothetical protein
LGNSACHNSHKIAGELIAADIGRAPDLPSELDLSPCDFLLFGFLKESMEGGELSVEDQIIEAVTIIWRGFTFDTLQSVF